MAKILSFSKARKKEVRRQKEKKAEENRIKFGRTKAEKNLNKSRNDKNNKNLDNHRLDD